MWRVLRGTVVLVLCCIAGLVAVATQPDARLLEAQGAFDDAARLKDSGRYADATRMGERGLVILQAARDADHPDVARALGNVATLYCEQGQYARARPLHERALAIQEAAFGENHLDVAKSLNNLALVYFSQGLHAQAEPLHRRALAIQEALLGRNHPDVARTLNHLALLYSDQGLYARAESLHARALAIREAVLGRNHPEVAYSLNNLASLLARQGLSDRALPLYERALSILEAELGEKHPDVAGALNNLALFHSSQGQYAQAESLHRRALSIQEASRGADHLDVAASLNNLALLYFEQGSLSLAEPLYVRALSIQTAALGADHPDLGSTLNNLGELRLAQHQLAEAVPLFTRAFALSERRLRQEALGLSEARLASLLQLHQRDEERIYSLLRAHPHDVGVRRLALTTVLLRKDRSVEQIAGTSRAVYRDLAEEDRDTFEQLRDLRTQLATLSLQGRGTLPPAEYQQRLRDLTRRGDALTAQLARRSAHLRALTELPAPEDIINRVAATLPPDGALVELVAYMDRPPGPRTGTARSQLHYLALVLHPDASIHLVDLGPAAPIDRAATHLNDALAGRAAHYLRHAQALHRLAFKPLLPHLGGVRRIFLAPDGQLGLVSFDVLHDGARFLIDVRDISNLPSGRDLLPREQDLPPSSSVVVVADPVFDTAPGGAGSRVLADMSGSTGEERLFSTLDADLLERPWPPLPGTRREAESIQRILPQARLLLGPEANRQQLFHIKAPGILHFATHGFFFGAARASQNARGVGAFGGFDGGASALQRPANPLLRSGLVLSGAHTSTMTAAEAAGSAMMTALEFASLDLWGTQLVVLSACETGRGDIQPGQGIHGLRRAFFIAGAETVVMSLWKVNDDSTHLLMEHYYRELMAGKGRADALRDAARTLRKTWPHPHYWAPFISVGQDGPLRSFGQELSLLQQKR